MQKQEFEVHLTADIKSPVMYHQFKTMCKQLDAKPLEIILARGMYSKQIMLSKCVYSADLSTVLEDIVPWIKAFEQQNIQIIRTKIELPFQDSQTDQQSIYYYEWHALIECSDALELKQLCEHHQAHLSQNALKRRENFRFLTLREIGTADFFLKRLELLRIALLNQHRVIVKERFEICIYDTNIMLDHGWLS